MEKFLFFFFSILSLVCGLFVVTSRNPIHSVLFLVLVFFNVSGILILLGVEFLALLFFIVYVVDCRVESFCEEPSSVLFNLDLQNSGSTGPRAVPTCDGLCVKC